MFKANWMEQNKPVLEQEYETWVQQHIAYNSQLVAAGQLDQNGNAPIADEATFKQTYPP